MNRDPRERPIIGDVLRGAELVTVLAGDDKYVTWRDSRNRKTTATRTEWGRMMQNAAIVRRGPPVPDHRK